MASILDDNFNRPDGTVGNGWIDLSGGKWAIAGNVLTCSGANQNFQTDWLVRPAAEAATDGTEQFYLTLSTQSDGTPTCNFCYVRASSSRNGYGFWVGGGGGGGCHINGYVSTGGVPSGIVSSAAALMIAAGTPVILTVTATGSTLTGSIATQAAPGTTLATVSLTDSGFASGVAALSPSNEGAEAISRVVTSGTLVNPPAGESPPTVAGPAAYQVFQRSSSGTAAIAIAGTNAGTAAHSIEASWGGGAFVTIATGVAPGANFAGTLANQPKGQGTLVVRYKDNTALSASVPFVGVGDVFALAGQSNCSGRFVNGQVVPPSKFKAGLFGNDNSWKVLADPVDATAGQVDAVSQEDSSGNAVGASQGSPGGSYWPIFAGQWMAASGCPVALIPCALGGSSSSQWQPGANHQDRTTLYGSMVYRALKAGGVAGVLWHQGETDASQSATQATYFAKLSAIAAAVQADLGCRLRPAKLQSGGSLAAQSALDAVNAAVAQAWQAGGVFGVGPDLSGLTVDDGYAHLTSDANAQAAGTLWAMALVAPAATGGGTTPPDSGSGASVENIADMPIEPGVTFRQSQRAVLAALAGNLLGAGTGTVVIQGAGTTTTRITATTDDVGNRTVTLSLGD